MVPIVYMADIHINIVMLHTENPLSMHFVMDKGIFFILECFDIGVFLRISVQ